MGYFSEVVLLVAVQKPEQADELMAVYALDPNVQKYDLLKKWTRHDYAEDGIVLAYYNPLAKWYSEYEDVQGMERLLALAKDFSDERGHDVGMLDENGEQPVINLFPYAATKIRIGEEMQDIEGEHHSSDTNLEEMLWQRATVRRSIELDL